MALRGRIIGLIPALKPCYVPGIHGRKGAGLHYLINIQHFFYSMMMKARAHEARTHKVVSNGISFLRSIFKIKRHVR